MSYPGGKAGSGVYQLIINQQPLHRTYIEPFLGGGAVMLMKRPAEFNIGIDRDVYAVRNFRALGTEFHVLSGDAIAYIEKRRWRPDDLVYCDPPYLLSTRAHRRIYRCELTDKDHARLLRSLTSIPAMVQISGYWSQLYADRLKSWRLIRYQAMTRGGPREECLWMNYSEPTVLHDTRFTGGDYRERERIRKKVNRWRRKLASLSELERGAILAALQSGKEVAGTRQSGSAEL